MQYTFYNGYNIIDDDIDCNKVITVDCNGLHHYSDVCELMNNCLSNIPRQLTSDCVVDFLNTLDTQQAGNFVRIDSNYCLESVPLDVINTDRYVGVDSTDTPGYLESKIVGCGDITVNKIGSGSNKQLEICYNGPNSMTELSDVEPTLYNDCSGSGSNALVAKFLTVDTVNDRVNTMCLEKPMGALFNPNTISIGSANIGPNEIKHFYIGDMNNYQADDGMVFSMPVSTGIIIGSQWTILKAIKPGIRRVSMKGNVRVNGGVQAFRIYVVAGDNSLNGCVDSKFGSSHSPQQPLVRRYNEPITEETYAYFNVGGSCLVEITDPRVSFGLRIAIDSNAGTNIQPKVDIFAGGLTGGTYNDPEGNYGSIAGLSLQLEFIRDKGFDNKAL